MTEPSKVQVLRIRLAVKLGAMRAFADIRIGGIIINDLRIIQENGKAPWVSMPVNIYKTKHGHTIYKPVVLFTDENLMSQISEAVLRAWEHGKEGSDGN